MHNPTNFLCGFDMPNVLFEGVISGVIASICFALLLMAYRNLRDLSRYKSLLSPNDNEFDWTCYSITDRKRGSVPNGSLANISRLRGNTLVLKVRQNDNRVWTGKVVFTDRYLGELYFKYEKGNEYEYGFKNVFIGEDMEDGKKYQFIYLRGQAPVYGDELVRREKT